MISFSHQYQHSWQSMNVLFVTLLSNTSFDFGHFTLYTSFPFLAFYFTIFSSFSWALLFRSTTLPFLLFRFTLKLKINNLIFCKISIFSISSGSLIFPSLRRLNFFFNFYNLFGICRFSETEDNNFVFHKIFIFFYFPWFVDLSLLRHLTFFFICLRFADLLKMKITILISTRSHFFLFLLVC